MIPKMEFMISMPQLSFDLNILVLKKMIDKKLMIVYKVIMLKMLSITLKI